MYGRLMANQLPQVAEAEHITSLLRRAGALGAATVRDVVVESDRRTLLSRVIRLRLGYDGDGGESPCFVFLKTAHPERAAIGWAAAFQEVAFYRDIAALSPPGLLPRCFDAQADPATQTWHLLLEDLADSHVVPTTWPLPPSLSQCERIVAARARFHAVWWDDARLGVSIGAPRDPATRERFRRDFDEKYTRLAERLGDDLSPEQRTLCERLPGSTRLFKRFDSRHNLTIIHGDAHVWNCFMPRDGGDDVRLFDWDAWRISIGTTDLAYMMAVHWYPDRRRRMERALLDHYHAVLLENGVANYDRQALDDDYRLAVLWQLVTPVWQAAYDIPPGVWWNNMQRVLLAIDDLGCRELLD
jgi:hypothetical protein